MNEKKLYILLNCQNYNFKKISSNQGSIDFLSKIFGQASKDRMPVIYIQKWGNEMERSVVRNTHDSDIVPFLTPMNPFIVECEHSYKFISPIGNRNIIIRYDEYLNLNTPLVLNNILENHKLEINEIVICGVDDDNFFQYIVSSVQHAHPTIKITNHV